VGDPITVQVLQVDDGKGRIALGLKQLQPDPWRAAGKYEVGQVVAGRVSRLADFGAFVELEPGIEALAHASSFAPAGPADAWKAKVVPGSAVQIEIVSVDLDRKRIGVALREVSRGTAEEQREAAEYAERQGREGTEGFGSLADKLRTAMRPPSKK
jgi:ribosomal protein S1